MCRLQSAASCGWEGVAILILGHIDKWHIGANRGKPEATASDKLQVVIIIIKNNNITHIGK